MSDKTDWCVIGAGVAGICMIGRLLDHGVPANEIAWIDPDYRVGDLGKYWNMVQSNTDASALLNSLKKSPSFAFNKFNQRFKLQDAEPNKTVPLIQVVQPLQAISDNLKQQVTIHSGHVSELYYQENWHIKILDNLQITSSKVVLATGSEPNAPHYHSPNTIPLTIALNPEKMSSILNPDDIVLVFGSSHSAILVMKNLVDAGIEKIINIYRRNLIYAETHDGKIKYDITGLKGIAAIWAKQHLEVKPLKNISRHLFNQVNIKSLLKMTTKQIYATGFQRRNNIMTTSINLNHYDKNTGFIADNLYGLGIAYPLFQKDSFGIKEYKVGINCFLNHADLIIKKAQGIKATAYPNFLGLSIE